MISGRSNTTQTQMYRMRSGTDATYNQSTTSFQRMDESSI